MTDITSIQTLEELQKQTELLTKIKDLLESQKPEKEEMFECGICHDTFLMREMNTHFKKCCNYLTN